MKALAAIVRVRLGDGTVRVEARERVEYTDGGGGGGTLCSAAPGWETWSALPDPARPPPPPALAKLAHGSRWYWKRWYLCRGRRCG